MADNIIKIPKLNPVQFYELDRIQPDVRYNHFPVNEDLYWFSLKQREAKRLFFQRWQYNDLIEFQIHTSKTFMPIISLVDKNGVAIHNWTAQSQYTITGNVTSYNGTNVQLHTHHFRFSLANVPHITDGFYWLKLSVPIDTISGGAPESEIVYLSDPIYATEKHENTILVEYKHKTNKYDVIFTQSNAKFSIRVPGVITEFEPLSNDTSYKDQVEKVTQLSSFPSESYKLYIGGASGITDQLYNVINRVLSCSDIKVDGMGIVKEEGAKWETVRTPHNPLKWASIAIRKKENENSFMKSTKAALKLFTKNSTARYFIHTVSFTDGTKTVTLPDGPILGAASEAAYINNLSGTFSQLNALTGFFTFYGNDFIYMPGIGETFHTVSESTVFVKSFSFYKFLSPGLNILTIDMDMSTASEKIGIVNDEFNNSWSSYSYSTTSVSEVFTYTAPTGIVSPKIITVFHKDNIGRFSIDDIWNIGGVFPNIMTEMILTNYKSSSFDFSLLEVCKTTFTSIKISGDLTDVVSINPVYTTLLNLDFRNNKLTQNAVGNILAGIHNAVSVSPGMVGGDLKLESQTPSVSFTPIMTSIKNSLQTTYSWTVTN